MINIIKADLKLKKFKNLMAHTLAASSFLSPLIISIAVLSSLEELVPAMTCAGFFMATQAIFGMMKFLDAQDLDSTAFKWLNAPFWRMLLDKPALKKVRIQQKRLLDSDVVEAYVAIKLNWHVFEEYESGLMMNCISRNKEENPVLEKKMFYVSHEKARSILAVCFKDYSASLMSEIESRQSVGRIALSIANKYEEIDLFAINNKERIRFILSSGGYHQLKEQDYQTIDKLLASDAGKAFDILTSLYTFPQLVDWPQVKEMLARHTNESDARPQTHIAKIKALMQPEDVTPLTMKM